MDRSRIEKSLPQNDPPQFNEVAFLRAVNVGHQFNDYSLTVQDRSRQLDLVRAGSAALLQGLSIRPTVAYRFFDQILPGREMDPSLADFGLSFLRENLDHLETMANKSPKIADKTLYFKLISKLAEYGDPKQREAAIEKLLKNLPGILSPVPPAEVAEERSVQSEAELRDQFTAIFEYGNNNQRRDGRTVIDGLLEPNQVPELRNAAGYFIAQLGSAMPPQEFEMLSGHFLQTHSLPHSLLDYWMDTGYVGANIERVADLEKARPGAAKTLFNEFKIRNFNRYNLELLIDQYDEKDRTDLPYGLIFSAIADDNRRINFGAEAAFRLLHLQLKKLGVSVRAYDCMTDIELARSLINANKRYGRGTPEFLILNGHGTRDMIQLGQWINDNRELPGSPGIAEVRRVNRSRSLSRSAFTQGRFANRLPGYFAPDPTIILAACNGGQEEGLGQEISKLGAEVLGAADEARGRSFTVGRGPDDRLHFDALFPGATTMRYKNGVLVS